VTDQQHLPTVGERVRSCRRYRGMSLQLLADRSGLSKGFLSMVENGQRHLERRQHLTAVAEALQVSVADLTGQPYAPVDPTQGGAHASVPDVRTALMGSSLDYADRDPSRPVAQLVEDTAAVMNLRQACEYEQVGRALSRLLPDLHAAVVRAPEREPALQSVVLASQAATLWLKNLGYHDLAWIAADRGWQAALRLEDPLWISAADFARTQALSGLGAYTRLAAVASRAAESTPTATQEGLEVYAIHRLTEALGAAATGTADPGEALAEAHAIAARTGQGTAFWFMFGPTNAAQWEMSITLERGDPDRAIAVAADVNADDIPVRSRKAAYYTDLGIALSTVNRRDVEAVEALRRAEHLAPDRVRNNPLVREKVNDMLQRARREAGGRNLRGLAHRIGLAP
jgi:transcriptional regulator with XRE-family HTH domain